MIAININKAKAIAQQLAAHVQDAAKRAEHQNAIDQAQDVQALALIVEEIKADL